MCVFRPPEPPGEPRRRERGSARGGRRRGGAASRGRGRAWSDGGRARKISFSQSPPLAAPHTPSVLLSHSPPPRLWGGESRFLASPGRKKKKNGVGGGEGREASGTAREPASICTRAVPSFPPHPRAERGRGRGGGPGRGSAGFAGSLGLIRAWVAAQAGPAVVVVGRLRGPAEDAAQAAARSARPWGGRLRGPCQPAGRETEDCGGERFLCFGDFFFCYFGFLLFAFFFFRPRGLLRVPLPESPRKRLLGVGTADWRTLRWRWAWPVARAGGAVARRPPSSLVARAAPGVEARPMPGAAERGSPGARNGPPGPEDGTEAAETRATTTTPNPKGWLAGLGLEGTELAAVCSLSFVSGRK